MLILSLKQQQQQQQIILLLFVFVVILYPNRITSLQINYCLYNNNHYQYHHHHQCHFLSTKTTTTTKTRRSTSALMMTMKNQSKNKRYNNDCMKPRRKFLQNDMLLIPTTIISTLFTGMTTNRPAQATTTTTTSTTKITANNIIASSSLSSSSSSLVSAVVADGTTTTTSSSSTTTTIDPRAIITIRIQSSNDRLGVELINTTLRGKNIVVIKNVGSSRGSTSSLKSGMILLNYEFARDVINRIQNGPYPFELKFYNLAAAGDAFNDDGTTIVSAQDAFDLAKRTDNNNNYLNNNNNNNNQQQQQQQNIVTAINNSNNNNNSVQQQQYSITTIEKPLINDCAIETRRNDLLEIEYEAAAVATIVAADSKEDDNDNNNNNKKLIVYDASYMRGTGTQPYQMVLGSGDMLPGVDQGLYNMCPGEKRIIQIPSQLAYGQKGNKLYKIPPNTSLQWTIELISIDGLIRKDNNNIPRSERDFRAMY